MPENTLIKTRPHRFRHFVAAEGNHDECSECGHILPAIDGKIVAGETTDSQKTDIYLCPMPCPIRNSIKRICQETQVQNCHICEDFKCGDNINPVYKLNIRPMREHPDGETRGWYCRDRARIYKWMFLQAVAHYEELDHPIQLGKNIQTFKQSYARLIPSYLHIENWMIIQPCNDLIDTSKQGAFPITTLDNSFPLDIEAIRKLY